VPTPRSQEQRTTDDGELVRRAQHDPRHFEALYTAYVDRVYRFLALRVARKEVAEDLTSQTFLKALEHLDSYKPTAPFSAWIFRIARNLLIDHYRVSGRTVPLDEALDLGFDAGIREQAEKNMQRDAVLLALSKLTDAEREVLVLRVGSDLSHGDIASITERSEAATKMAYMRAVQHLRTLLSAPPPA
jgi:RNA polymerase sigma-70 factor (ECF subfamily)